MSGTEVAHLPDLAAEPPALPVAIIQDYAYMVWAVFQQQFLPGESVPPRARWDARMAARHADPDIRQPFEDCALKAAAVIYDLTLRRLAVADSTQRSAEQHHAGSEDARV